MLYGGDDPSFFAFATALSYGTYPYFDKEYVDESKDPPLARLGPGLMMTPFVFAFSWVDRLTHHPIVEKRTATSIVTSWSLYGAFISALVYFWMGLYFLFNGLSLMVEKKWAIFSVITMALFQGLPLYAFRRPIFSHVYEFFVMSWFISAIILSFKDGSKTPSRKVVFLYSLALILVRQTGVVFAGTAVFCLEYLRRKKVLKKSILPSVLILLGSFLIADLFQKAPRYLNPHYDQDYNAAFEKFSWMFRLDEAVFYLKRVLKIFFGLDWGLVFTAPFLLLGWFALFFRKKNEQKIWIFFTIPFFVLFYIVILWGGQGSWYGYRYLLIGIPLFILPFTQLCIELFNQSRKCLWLLCGIGVLPLFSMLVFEHSPRVGLSLTPNDVGGVNWSHATYQIEVWKLVLGSPFEFLYSMLKSGGGYLIYVFSNVLNLQNHLPSVFLKVYPHFDSALVIKAIGVYVLPFVLLRITRKVWR